MEAPRPLHDHELTDFVRFLTEQLRPGRAWTIADEYPLAITNANCHNVRIIRDDTTFKSAAVMKPLVVRSPAGLFKVAAIGSVVTNPDHRNQGLSKQIMDASLDSARAQGCDFAILWTNLFEFYRKLGFELAGSEVALTLKPNFPTAVDEVGGLRFTETAKVDPEAILRLYAEHKSGSVRTAEDIRRFLNIPNARVYTAWDASNRLCAYAVEGKGADLEGYVHEWGGGVSKLIPLLRFVTNARGGDLHVISPAHSTNLIRRLKDLGASEHGGVLGMIKILNAKNLLTKIKKYARAMGADDLALEARDDLFYLGTGEDMFRTDAEADLVKLIFGPLKASQINGFNKTAAAALERVLPIPLWIWGWDSV